MRATTKAIPGELADLAEQRRWRQWRQRYVKSRDVEVCHAAIDRLKAEVAELRAELAVLRGPCLFDGPRCYEEETN